METSQALQELDLDALVGLSVADARQAVEAAGGTLRVVAPGAILTQEYRYNRVTVLVEDERVTQTRGLG